MENLKGKVALVTGAGQGVGLGIAQALAARGATVALVGRTLSKLEDAAAQIKAAGGNAAPFSCDVKDAAAISKTVEDVAASLGGIDILVNNAQEVPMGPLLKLDDDAFSAGFDSGPLATLRFMKACHPHMVKRGGGVIINLTSSATRRWDMSGYGAYAAVKEAIVSLSRAATSEWGGDNIRVLIIAPLAGSPALEWWIRTNPEESEAYFKTIPLHRVGECEGDIGRAVAALCGPEFGYLTGAIIPLDGGQGNFA